MTSKDILHEIQLQIYEAFKSQDPELFDVVFELEGKKIYAHKYRLSIISSTFKSMLSDRWISKNDVIKIEAYKFDDFKELLTFLYSGDCKLTDENIFAMLDIAEFYQVYSLKKFCGEYLLKVEYNLENVFKLLEISIKYSLIDMKKGLKGFISQNFTSFSKSDDFLNAKKYLIKELIALKIDVQPEEMFLVVYHWAENQATKKQKETNDENLNMNDAIKTEISDFLPYIEFKRMGISFLHEHVVKRGYLFSYDALSGLLKFAFSVVNVKVTNSDGQSIYGHLPRENDDAVNVIKSLRNVESVNNVNCFIHWNTKCKIPSTPPLKKKDGVKYYLIYFSDGDIGVKDSSKLRELEYLLAEMHSQSDFSCTKKSKVVIY